MNREVEDRRTEQMAVLEAEKTKKRAEMLAAVEAEKAERLRRLNDDTLPPPHGLPAIRPDQLFGYQDDDAGPSGFISPFAPNAGRQSAEQDNDTASRIGPTTAQRGTIDTAQADASTVTAQHTRRQSVKQEPNVSPGLALPANPGDAQANESPAPATTAAAPEKRKRGRPLGSSNKAKSAAVLTCRVIKKSATVDAPRKLRSGSLYESLGKHGDEDVDD